MRSAILLILFSFSFAVGAHQDACEHALGKTDKRSSQFKAQEVINEIALTQVMDRSEAIITKGLEAGLLKKKEVEHLREDLGKLRASKNKKESHETFKMILAEWDRFLKTTESQLDLYKGLSTEEQKAWKSKMELPVYFATGHFIVFLETGKESFNYSTMYNVLKAVNDAKIEDPKVFMYLFEKTALKYFSLNELRTCRA